MAVDAFDAMFAWQPGVLDHVVDSGLFVDDSPSAQPYVTLPDPNVISVLRSLPPVLESNPGAPATIHLNFTGNTVNEDWSYSKNRAGTKTGNLRGYTTPAFDTDGDPTALSDAERTTITEVWRRVADDFSPFHVNVTTSFGGRYENGKALNVAIGGRFNGWFDDSVSGYGTDGGFANDEPNTVLVFADTISTWTLDGHGRPTDFVSMLAGTISHEAGHGLGLKHHQIYDVSGNVVDEYHPGTWAWTPLMGENLSSLRTTFSIGQVGVERITGEDGFVSNRPVLQNDYLVIAGEENGFGWRPDDHSDFGSFAASMSTDGLRVRRADGIIGHWGDRDVFQFTTDGGPVRVSLDGPTANSNLIGKLTLSGGQGALGSSMMAWNSNHTELTANVAAGTYYVTVESVGGLDNLGMYSVSVDAQAWWIAQLDLVVFNPHISDWLVDSSTANVIDVAVPSQHVATPQSGPTLPGDANADGRFDSGDLVLVFQAGKYENAIATDSVFAEGDWNGDGDFDSSDLVLAFQLGHYELGHDEKVI